MSEVTKNKREPMNPDLLRQRRNLMVISLVLTAVNIAGASIEPKVSVFGTVVTFSHPHRLLIGAWIVWAYFLLRYWQYLSDEPDINIFTEIFYWFIKQTPYINWLYKDETSTRYWDYRIATLYPVHRNDFDIQTNSKIKTFESLKIWAMFIVFAFFWNAFRTSKFTDYVLPFLVAATPLTLEIIKHLKPYL